MYSKITVSNGERLLDSVPSCVRVDLTVAGLVLDGPVAKIEYRNFPVSYRFTDSTLMRFKSASDCLENDCASRRDQQRLTPNSPRNSAAEKVKRAAHITRE